MSKRSAARSANRLVLVAIAAVLLVFILLVSYLVYGDAPNGNYAVEENTATLATVTDPGVETKDTDGDGLADWEEVLWNTDPTKADTDGDGHSDKDQASARGGFALSNVPENGDDSTASLTSTDMVARAVFGSYMQAFENDGTLTAEEQEQVINDALAQSMHAFKPPKHDPAKIKTIAATEGSRRLYAERSMSILRAQNERITRGEHEIIMDLASKRGSGEAKQELLTVAAVYSSTAREMQDLFVPEDIAIKHGVLIDAILAYAYVLDGIARMEDDGMLGLMATGAFETSGSSLRVALLDIGVYALYHDPEYLEKALGRGASTSIPVEISEPL